jgi:hypothetical protein
MAIITKKVGNKVYAYTSEREGKKVVHKYLGPVDDPAVEKTISAYRGSCAVPEVFGYLFWDARLEDIHVRRNARYIIERMLDIGNLDGINWLQRIYPVQKIIEVLTSSRNLSQKSKNFWRLWFDLENT